MKMPDAAAPAPSVRRLVLTALLALVSAAVIVMAFVLPAEYGVDPLGTGARLGLIAMAAPGDTGAPPLDVATDRLTPTLEGPVAHYGTSHKVDAIRLELGPYEYVEYKYRLEAGATMVYSWSADAELIHDFHADPDGAPPAEPVSFDKRNRRTGHGVLTAPFAGIHGWYWENPGAERVTVSLVSAGFYSSALEMRSNRRRLGREVATPAVPAAVAE
jgi:hypothetical protein